MIRRTYFAEVRETSRKHENSKKGLILGVPVDIACIVETNVWRGKESIQLNARDIRLSSAE